MEEMLLLRCAAKMFTQKMIKDSITDDQPITVDDACCKNTGKELCKKYYLFIIISSIGHTIFRLVKRESIT